MAINKTCILCFALLLAINPSTSLWTSVDEEGLETSLELDEYDFDDYCKMLDDPKQVHDSKVVKTLFEDERAKALTYAGHKENEYPERKVIVARKLEVASKPGDVLLSEEDYTKLLDFTAEVVKALTNESIDCEQILPISSLTSINTACDLTFRDAGQLLTSWNLTLSPDIQTSYPEILDLVSSAALANGAKDVESYWLMLSELESDGYQKAKELWQDVRPLYEKMHLWVATKLEQRYGPFDGKEGRLPSYLLGSRLGVDWTSLAETMLTNQCKDVYLRIRSALEENQVAGKLLYQKTEKMVDLLNVNGLEKSFWELSEFNHSCPALIVDHCRSTPRVHACGTPSWSEYLRAHELTMTNVQNQAASNSEHAYTYLLRNAKRYSAVDTGVAGLATLLASNRHYLAQSDLDATLEAGGTAVEDGGCLPDVILTLVALKTLPKLPYYLAADVARLEAIRTNATHRVAAIWNDIMASGDMQEWEGQENHTTEYWAFLEDLHITSNQPYISHFYGVFLQFQLYEEMLLRDEAISKDRQRFIQSRRGFRTLLEMGKSKRWPQLLKDTLQIEEISSAHLLRFFRRFDEFISSQVSDGPKVLNPRVTPAVPVVAPEVILPKVLPVEPPRDAPIDAPRNLPVLPLAAQDAANDSTDASVPEGTEVPTENSAETTGPLDETTEKGFGVGDILLIACLIVGAVVIIGVIINYGRKRIKKLHEYRRPTNQPA